jgi:hypothetical protein
MSKHTKFNLLAIALISIIGLAIYFNSFKNGFVYDDDFLVVKNSYLRSWRYIPNIFATDIFRGSGEESAFYRPIQTLSYLIDYSLWKLNPLGYHLTNFLLHFFNAILIYFLVNLISLNKKISLITALFFIIYPIHTEAVTYISGRADLLATFFLLLCFIFYIKHLSVKSTKVYTLMVLSYVLALLSKENSLILPVLLLLYHYAFKKKLESKGFSSIVGVAFVYILLRLTLLKFLLPRFSDPATLFQRLPGFFVAVTNYIRLVFLPFNLHMEYGYRLFNFTDLKALIGVTLLFSLLIYAFRKRRSNAVIFFSISWFFLALLPVSNLYPINAYMAEHWLYLPSIGFFIILGKGLNCISRKIESRNTTIVFLIGLAALYSYLTIKQNEYWKKPITFYKRTLKYASGSPRIYHNLGLIYYDLGKKEEAITLYKKALQLNPEYAKAYNNLGLAYYDLGKKEEAISLFKKAIEIDPHLPVAYNNLAMAYYDKKQYDLAIKYCDKAIDLGLKVHPEFLEALKPYRR